MYTCKTDINIFYEQKLSITQCFICLRPTVYTLSLQLHHIYFISPAYIERSNVLTHLVAPYCGQATRDIRVLNMYSECKSRAEARPLAAV